MATALTDADLYRLLTFHVLNPMTNFSCVLRSEGSVQVRGPIFHFVTCYVLTVRNSYALAQYPSWRITHRRLSASAYKIHSELPFVSCPPLYLQREMAPCRGDTDPFIIAKSTGDYRFRGIGSTGCTYALRF